jgi:CRISPR/Cas system-associated exonuclease Cas4 (RecB family)
VDDAARIVEAIDAAYESAPREDARQYIGASVIGRACDAFIALSLRGFPEDPVSPKLKRIFAMGHIIEDIVIEDLQKAGIAVMARDPITRKQHHFEAMGGHVKTNLDGLYELPDGSLRIVEIKSMNDASWSKFKTDGVRSSHRHYYDQMQMMMGLSGITSALFIAYNKNTSLYHAQIVEFDEMDWEFLKSRIETAFKNEARKIAKDESDWRCRGCSRFSVCWRGKTIRPSCEKCKHASPLPNGTWHCALKNKQADVPCGDFAQYQPLPKE